MEREIVRYRNHDFKNMNVMINIYENGNNNSCFEVEKDGASYLLKFNGKRVPSKSNKVMCNPAMYEVVGERPFHLIGNGNRVHVISGIPKEDHEVPIIDTFTVDDKGNISCNNIDRYKEYYSIGGINEYNKLCHRIENKYGGDIARDVLKSFGIKKNIDNNTGYLCYSVYGYNKKFIFRIYISNEGKISIGEDDAYLNDYSVHMEEVDYFRFINMITMYVMDKNVTLDGRMICTLDNIYDGDNEDIISCVSNNNVIAYNYYSSLLGRNNMGIVDVLNNNRFAIIIKETEKFFLEDYELDFSPVMLAKAAVLSLQYPKK